MPASRRRRGPPAKRVSHARLVELLDYSPETGIFRWKVRRSRGAKPGSIAGTRRKHGYIAIQIDGRNYLAHHLAWMYVHKRWPENELDHRNLQPSDNSIDNLRESTRSTQNANQAKRRDNTSGYKGVSYRAGSAGWQAKITIQGKQKHLGYFPTPELAHEAWKAASVAAFGDFSRAA